MEIVEFCFKFNKNKFRGFNWKVTGGCPLQRACNAVDVSISWRHQDVISSVDGAPVTIERYILQVHVIIGISIIHSVCCAGACRTPSFFLSSSFCLFLYVCKNGLCGLDILWRYTGFHVSPDSKIHGTRMGPIWGRQDPGGPYVGPMNLAIWDH